MTVPLLSLLIAAPLAGAVAVALIGAAHAGRVAALTLALTLALAIAAVVGFDPAYAGFQWVENAEWMPSLNIHYLIGVDGLSLLFLPLSVLVFIGVLIDGWNSRRPMPQLYHALLLAQLSVTLGVFCALDTLLFFLFWELSLLPLYFLLSIWGCGPRRSAAAAQYVLVMMAGGAFLLFGFLLAGSSAGWIFDLPGLLAHPAGQKTQLAIFLLLVAGFAAKTPLVPLHAWLPTTAMEGPVALTALIVGLKLGAYGLIRFAVPLAPLAARELHWLLAGLGTLGVLYGAVAALAQTNLRRMLAYASVSHVGLVLLGIASFEIGGLQGAVMLLLNFTLSAGGLFILTGFLHRRTGSADVVALGGLALAAPRLAALFLILGLASVGLPGLSGFPAEFAIVLSALASHTGAGLAALFGAIVGAAAFISLYRQAFFGPTANATPIPDLLPRELAYAGVLAALALLAGLAPALVFDLIRPSVTSWVAAGAG